MIQITIIDETKNGKKIRILVSFVALVHHVEQCQ